jgi:hypothetical protein
LAPSFLSGLYLNPPDKALVLCVDEKAQIQALDRSQPLLPMRPGQVERRTHDYVRHGTTSLFAAFDTQSGRVIGQQHRRHRAIEFRKFLDTIGAAVPEDLNVHLIVDNYATHKTALISTLGCLGIERVAHHRGSASSRWQRACMFALLPFAGEREGPTRDPAGIGQAVHVQVCLAQPRHPERQSVLLSDRLLLADRWLHEGHRVGRPPT